MTERVVGQLRGGRLTEWHGRLYYGDKVLTGVPISGETIVAGVPSLSNGAIGAYGSFGHVVYLMADGTYNTTDGLTGAWGLE